jgi:hypothetical protein
MILGALAMLGGCVQIGVFLALPQYLAMFEEVLPAEASEAMRASMPHPVVGVGVQVLVVGTAALHVLAGRRLWQRRQAGARLMRRWAALKIAVALVSGAVGLGVGLGQVEAMRAAGPGSMPAGVHPAMTLFSVVGGVLWLWALPVFVLIWLNRSTIRAEVAGWAA